MRKVLFTSLLAFLTTAVFAQNEKMSAYTQHLLMQAEDTPSLLQSQSSMISAFVFVNDENLDADSLSAIYDSKVVYRSGDMFTARIPAERLEDFANDENVNYIEAGMPVTSQIATARTFGGVNEAQNGEGGLPNGFTGKDVIVGVVDLGFQYDHIGFYDKNDDYESLRVKKALDIAKGWVYEDQKEIEDAKKDIANSDGHGTHVANVAAGAYSDTSNDFRGVAPEADIVLASFGLNGNTTEIYNCVRYIIDDYAKSAKKPVVVNLSLGSQLGPHDGTSTFDTQMEELLDNGDAEGVVIVGAAGNYGNFKLYKENQYAAKSEGVNYIKSSKFASAKNAFVDIWGSVNQAYSIALCFANTSGEIQKEIAVSGGKEYTDFADYGSGNIAITTKNAKNGKKDTYVALNNFSIKPGYKFGIKIKATDAGIVRMWGSDDNITWEDVTSTSNTVNEIGGTANSVITVGAFTSAVNSYSQGKTLGAIAPYSGKGPTADGRLKPDVIAPGDALFSALPDDVSGARGKQTITYNDRNYNFGYETGTSMSTPFVTGVVALWLQADPTLTANNVREIISETSTTDEYTGECPNNTAGYGKINALAGLKKILKITAQEEVKIDENRIVISNSPAECSVLFLNDESNVTLSIYNAQGNKVYSQFLGNISRADEEIISLSDLSAGVYVVCVDSDTFHQTYNFWK